MATSARTMDGYSPTTPNWGEGGIWQSGSGLSGDGSGNVYAVCGNGGDASFANAQLSSGPFFGQSTIKLKADPHNNELQLVDWYTPHDVLNDNRNDFDMCAGPVLLPWNNLVGSWGKDRAYHIMSRANLGKFNPNANNIVQFAPGMTAPVNGGGTGHIHCAPVFFEDPTVGPVSYVWGENDMLRGYRFNTATSQFDTNLQPTLRSQQVLPIGMPGGMLTSSINGDGAGAAKGTAIVWACHPTAGNANTGTVAGVLEAFRADDL